MEVEHRFLFGMTETILLLPNVLKMTFGRLNLCEVGGRGKKYYGELLCRASR